MRSHVPPATAPLRLRRALTAYFSKWRGKPGAVRPPLPHWSEILTAFIGSCLAIGTLAAIQYSQGTPTLTAPSLLIVASFGASAVLLYAAPAAALSQPRNLMLGHMLSALVGVTVRILIVERGCADHGEQCVALGAALAVAFSVALMMATGTVHPPGAASALAAVIADENTRQLGYLFVVLPVGCGAAVMLLVALLVNNAHPRLRYPTMWW